MKIQDIQAYAKKRRLRDEWWISDGDITSKDTYGLAELAEQEVTVFLLNVGQTDNWLELDPTTTAAKDRSHAQPKGKESRTKRKSQAQQQPREITRPTPIAPGIGVKLNRIDKPKDDGPPPIQLPLSLAILALVLVGSGFGSLYVYRNFVKPAEAADFLPLDAGSFGMRVLKIKSDPDKENSTFDIDVVDSAGKIHHWTKMGDYASTVNGDYRLNNVDTESGKLIVMKSHPALAGLILKTIEIDIEAFQRHDSTRGTEIDVYMSNNPRPSAFILTGLQNEAIVMMTQIKSRLLRDEKEKRELTENIESIKNIPVIQRSFNQASMLDKNMKRMKILDSQIRVIEKILTTSRLRITEIRTRMKITSPQ